MVKRLEQPIHFIGIGGSGMSPLAEIALGKGMQVSGSDVRETPVTQQLVKRGATVCYQQNGEDLVKTAGTVVISSAIQSSNPEFQAAKKLGRPLLHRSDFLQALMQGAKAITIAGTSGKTTVTAMLSYVLQEYGLKPSAAVGGVMKNYGTASLAGAGELFVAEADESDGSFLKYRPHIGVVLNIDNDHLDFFSDLNAINQAFGEYLTHIDPEGCAVIGWDNKNSQTVGGGYEGARLTFGFRLGCDVRAINYRCHDDGVSFKAIVENDQLDVDLSVLGKHNVANALCVLAIGRALNLDIRKIAGILKGFSGVERRLSRIFASPKIKIYDDYAHNPAKIAACIHAIKESYPGFFCQVIFQPHRYSRLNTMYNEICMAFKMADALLVLPVYAAGELAPSDFSLTRFANDMAVATGKPTKTAEWSEQLVPTLAGQIKQPTVLLTVGAGDVWKIARDLGEYLHGESNRIEAGFNTPSL